MKHIVGVQIMTVTATLSSFLSSLASPAPTPGCAAPAQPAGFTTSVIPAAAAPTPAAAVQPAPAAAVPAYVFDPTASDNVAVYFGQPGSTPTQSLADTCADTNVDVVVLGFVTDVTFGGIYHRLQLSPSFPSTKTSLMKTLAPGLSFYPTLSQDISRCQTLHGKKILLSIGGEGNSLPLASDQAAVASAERLWELFGPVGRVDPGLRPFGEVVVDGFDLNKRDECAAHYDVSASRLRALAAGGSKELYLSAAPGCAYPDVSVHPGSHAIAPSVIPTHFSTPFKTRLFLGLAASMIPDLGALLPRVRAAVAAAAGGPDWFGAVDLVG
ncbi:glycoside hydrolase superfamily [Staphylotrichum tortipilum]|uniref:Glycoside hydrolase superfamily n=1 Tax=Staphylotrichum tortipilum TaxID=2831512 RepID=A0AAN6MJB4_9PEZI|nr:glycoside hydrolase superfamily [Staphylotrichum longicolle]